MNLRARRPCGDRVIRGGGYARPRKACFKPCANKPCAAVDCAPQAYACPPRTRGIAGQGQMLAIAPPLGMRPCAQVGGGQGARELN